MFGIFVFLVFCNTFLFLLVTVHELHLFPNQQLQEKVEDLLTRNYK